MGLFFGVGRTWSSNLFIFLDLAKRFEELWSRGYPVMGVARGLGISLLFGIS